jgi:hypothetical protein
MADRLRIPGIAIRSAKLQQGQGVVHQYDPVVAKYSFD